MVLGFWFTGSCVWIPLKKIVYICDDSWAMHWGFYAFQMEEGVRAEELQVQRCRARLDRLASASTGEDAEWEDMRLKRILVDYMLRMSYYDSATMLAETSGIQV